MTFLQLLEKRRDLPRKVHPRVPEPERELCDRPRSRTASLLPDTRGKPPGAPAVSCALPRSGCPRWRQRTVRGILRAVLVPGALHRSVFLSDLPLCFLNSHAPVPALDFPEVCPIRGG